MVTNNKKKVLLMVLQYCPGSTVTGCATSGDSSDAFHIGIEDVNKVVDLCRMLIKEGKQFAILIPISIVGEIARLENIDNARDYDMELTS